MKNTVKINDINSAGIRNQAKSAGITDATLIASNHKTGDARVDVYDVGGALVATTNGDPVWRDSDPAAFDQFITDEGIALGDFGTGTEAEELAEEIINHSPFHSFDRLAAGTVVLMVDGEKVGEFDGIEDALSELTPDDINDALGKMVDEEYPKQQFETEAEEQDWKEAREKRWEELVQLAGKLLSA